MAGVETSGGSCCFVLMQQGVLVLHHRLRWAVGRGSLLECWWGLCPESVLFFYSWESSPDLELRVLGPALSPFCFVIPFLPVAFPGGPFFLSDGSAGSAAAGSTPGVAGRGPSPEASGVSAVVEASGVSAAAESDARGLFGPSCAAAVAVERREGWGPPEGGLAYLRLSSPAASRPPRHQGGPPDPAGFGGALAGLGEGSLLAEGS